MPSSSSLYPFLIIIVSQTLILGYSVNGLHYQGQQENAIDSEVLTKRIATDHIITVDATGNGDFETIQSAIDSVPEGNINWVIIHVKKGIYREKVHIPSNKPNIFMRGEGRGKTLIVWSENSISNLQSATFVVEAHHVIAYGLSFKVQHSTPTDGTVLVKTENEFQTGIANNQSVAAFVGGNKIGFYDCAFLGSHNTLFDYKGMHYYQNCYIEGSIDVIFGRAKSLFHNCEIFVVADSTMEDVHGSITAHTRKSAGDNSGFVFVNVKVYGSRGNVFLGRAKEAFSMVIFAHSYLSKSIVPQGWTNWSYDGNTENVHHAEYNCHGPGAATEDPKGRAPWSKQLTHKEVAPFITLDYIHGKHWLPAWL